MYPNLELEMFKKKMSTRALAAELKISESATRKKLNGEFDFKLREAEAIIALFGRPWSYLFAREDKGKAG